MTKSARDILNDKKATLVIITAADITELDGTIADYSNIKDEPSSDHQTIIPSHNPFLKRTNTQMFI